MVTANKGAAVFSMVAALALAGCSASPQPEASSGAGDQTLVYGNSVPPNNLDPHKSLYSADCLMLCAIYDRLVHVDSEGKLIPGLAESWTFSDDALSLNLKIREGVTFADGMKLDAVGVKANLDRIRTLPGAPGGRDLAMVTDVAVTDPQTVTLALSQPYASLPGILSGLAGAIINPAALAKGTDLSATPDGAGAYRFQSYTPGSELNLVRNDDYWGNTPQLAGLNFKFISDSAAIANSLQAGQIDVAHIVPQNLKQFEDNPSFTVKEVTTLYQYALITNFALAGLEDVRARQAVLHGIDRESICAQIAKGQCAVSDQPFPEGYFANDPSIDQVLYPFDPEKARSLLAEAGVKDLSLSAVVPGQQFMALAQAIQAQLGEIGVELKLEMVDGNAMAQRAFVDKTSDMVITAFGGRPDPAQLFTVRYSAAGFYNPGGFTTDTMEKLLKESQATTDKGKRDSLLQAGSREAAESALSMMLYAPTEAYVMKNGVDFQPYVTGTHEFPSVTKK
ncbi:ABC transporter substrate-binding protein [Arthrobacter sp. D1-29]